MDINTLTIPEIEELFVTLSERLNQLREEAANEQKDLTVQIGEAVTSLDQLIGTPGVKNTTSINGVLAYTGAEMVTNAAVALPLAFQGLLAVASTLRDVATSIANQSPSE